MPWSWGGRPEKFKPSLSPCNPEGSLTFLKKKKRDYVAGRSDRRAEPESLQLELRR